MRAIAIHDPLLGELLLARRGAPGPISGRELPRSTSRHVLMRLLQHKRGRWAVRVLLAGGSRGASLRPLGGDDPALLTSLLPSLRVLRPGPPAGQRGEPLRGSGRAQLLSVEPDDRLPEAEPLEEPEKTWIEFQLVDEEEVPIAGIEYAFEVTDGRRFRGRTDETGGARFDPIDEGVCQLWIFPEDAPWGVPLLRAAPTAAEEEAAPEPPVETEPTWIEFQLVDEEGEPLAEVDYEIELTDGRRIRGRTDETGGARFEPIPEGECELWIFDAPSDNTVPTIASSEPTAEPAATPVLAADAEAEQSWIEVQLLDESGQPMAKVPYEIELTDGRIVKGVTDETGLARFESIPEGECVLHIPPMSDPAWGSDPEPAEG